METPLSTKRVTRSQTKKALMNSAPISTRRNEEVEKKQRTGKSDRCPLFDISNDSPIVGLAAGSLKTPSSFSKKKKDLPKMMTPGSGEALLRREVKTLLQKVEEEAADVPKLSFEHNLFVNLQGVVDSSSFGVLAQKNTPHLLNLSSTEADNGFKVTQVVESDEPKQETLESQKSLISRSLLLDFLEKTETSAESTTCSSTVGSVTEAKSSEEDDAASVWSIRVNKKSSKKEDEDSAEEEDDYDRDDYYDDEEADNGGLVDELCERVSKITVNEKKTCDFEGKHTRFVYNSEDEMEGEEEEVTGILRLKGLPTPEGKHLRFSNEEDE